MYSQVLIRSNEIGSGLHQQRGQALLEFTIAATFVLVPIFILSSYLGKIGDIQHRTMEAARYSAWETAVTGKTAEEISAEINARVLSAEHDNFDSERNRLRAEFDANALNPLYYATNTQGDYRQLLDEVDRSFVEVQIDNSSPDSDAQGLRETLMTTPIVKYDLSNRGLTTASVASQINDLHFFDLSTPLQPQSSLTLYTESWRQVSHGEVTSSIEDAVFGARAFDNAIFNSMADVASFVGFEAWEDFEPGLIRPDITPCSRVINGGSDRERAC